MKMPSKRTETQEQESEMAVATAEKPAETPRKRGRGGRPLKGTDRIPKILGFWKAVDSVDPKDWGTRAWISIYRVRPITDRLRSGSTKKIGKFGFKLDEEWIKAEHGSGTYKVYLTFKAPQADEKEIDTVDVDILDPKFPPNVMGVEWLNIPENRDWEWCRPFLKGNDQAKPVPATTTSDVLETFRTFNEMQDTLQARAQAAAPPPAPPATTPTGDPLTVGLAIAEKFMTMKADNPMVTLLTQQLVAAQAQSNDLMLKLIAAQAPKAQENGMVTLTSTLDLITDKVLPKIKEFMPALGESHRSRMGALQEMAVEIFKTPVMQDVGRIIATRMMTPPPAVQYQAAPGTPQIQPGAPPTPPPQPNPNKPMQFFENFAPALLNFFDDDMDGGDIAEYIWNGFGDDWQGVKWLTLKSQAGVANIVQLFRNAAKWPEIQPRETSFIAFVEDFVKWQPPAEELKDHSQDPPVDLDAEEATA